MTTVQGEKIARRKLSLLQLAQELGNVSKACKIVGYSRQQFYEIRRNFQLYGAEGLIDQLPGPKGPHPNRVSEEIEQAVLAHALETPTHGAQRVADELLLGGIQVSSGGEQGVQDRGLQPAAVLRDQEELPALRGRGADRPASGAEGTAPEPGE